LRLPFFVLPTEIFTMASLFARSYWDGFIDHWSKMFQNQDAVVLVVLGVGAVGVFIITRAKWKK